MSEALNPFYVHTALPDNSGGDEDHPERRYQYQAQLEALLPPTDRVYRNPETGKYFKVRAGQMDPPPGLSIGSTVVKITVAVCDENGWAQAWESGRAAYQVAEPVSITFPPNGAVPLAEQLEHERLVQCAECELAVRNEAARAAIPVYAAPSEDAAD